MLRLTKLPSGFEIFRLSKISYALSQGILEECYFSYATHNLSFLSDSLGV